MEFEIVTHGGFELMRDVWLFVSSLFGSNDFKMLVTAVFALTVVLAAASGALDAMLGGRLDSPFAWARGFFIGVFFYAVFLSSNAEVVIYDDVSGQSHTQGNVPVGIAMIAGTINKATIGLEDLVKTFLAAPTTPESVGYERGVKMLEESFDGAMKTALATQVAPQMWDSVYQYAKDCVAIEAARSSAYRATLDDTADALSSWSAAVNPVLYTYTGLNADGTPMTGDTAKENVTCTEAWNRMDSYFTGSDAWGNTVASFCNMMHFEASDPQSFAACKDVYETAVARWVLGGAAKAAEDVAKNILVGKTWYSFLASLNGSIETARAAAYARVSSQLSGAGLMAQEWLPTIKVVVFVVLVALTPVVFLLLVTPYGIDAFKFMVGSFIWWGLWCVVDQMMLVMWLNRVDAVFQAIYQGGGLGVNGLSGIWPLASKSMALLGNMRSFGMLLASTVTFAVFRFGGSAMAHMATGLGRATMSGAATAAGFLSPEEQEWDRTMQAVGRYQAQARAALDAAGHYGGWAGYARAKAEARVADEVAGVEGYRRIESVFGPGPRNVGGALGPGAAGGKVDAAARGGAALAMGGANLGAMYLARYTEGAARGEEYQSILDKVKTERPGVSSNLAAARYLAQPEMAGKYGVSEGLYREYANLSDAGVLSSGMSMADYVATREALKGVTRGADVFAFAREAEGHGLGTAEAAYGRSLFAYANALSRMETFEKTVEAGGFAEAGRILGEYQGAVEGLRTTTAGLGRDPAIYTEGQKVLNEAARSYVNAALGHYLETGRVPAGIEGTLKDIASTPEGERMLQKHLSGMEVANLTEGQAGRLNGLSEAAGLGARFKVGDTVRISLGLGTDPGAPFVLSHATAVSGAEARDLDRESSDRMSRLFVSYGGETARLSDAVMQRTGNKVTIEGTDASGGRRRVAGFVDEQLSGSGRTAKESLVVTGADWEYVEPQGTGEAKAGLGFAGEAPISSMLARDLSRTASFLERNVKNDADAQAVARQFASELPVDAKTSASLRGALFGQMEAHAQGNLKLPFFAAIGIGAKTVGQFVRENRDATTYDMVQALSQEILSSDGSPSEKASALQGLREWILETQSDLVGGLELLHRSPGNILEPRVDRVAPVLEPVFDIAGKAGGFVAGVGDTFYHFTGDGVRPLGALNRDLTDIRMQAASGTLPGMNGADEELRDSMQNLARSIPRILNDAGYSVKEGASASIVAIGNAAEDLAGRLRDPQD